MRHFVLLLPLLGLGLPLHFMLSTDRGKSAQHSVKREAPFPKMRFIQGGVFEMGEESPSQSNGPVHSVSILDFYLAETELTNLQYCVFLNDLPPEDTILTPWPPRFSKVEIERKNGVFTPAIGKSDYPVADIDWFSAVRYCNWLTEKTGKNYRLPTEAEWEYAAGGGRSNRTKWAGTNQVKQLPRYAHYDLQLGSLPVRSRLPNRLGLYDMSGNVAEWCHDWYSHHYYQQCQMLGQVLDPRGLPEGSLRNFRLDRVHRGGSFNSYSEEPVRVSTRRSCLPTAGYMSIGFRPVMTAH